MLSVKAMDIIKNIWMVTVTSMEVIALIHM